MPKSQKENKQKIKRPIDKRKIIQTIVILVIVFAMLLSASIALIYNLINL